MVAFGTGQRTPLSNLSGITYLGGSQTLYGVWDYNMTPWNGISTVQFANIATATVALSTCVGSTTLGRSQLQAQTVSIDSAANNNREIPNPSAVLWATTSACSAASRFGWLIDLPGPSTVGGSEQIVFNPEILGNAFVVNSIIPAGNTVLTCTPQLDGGFTYAINFLTGTAPNFFENFNSDTIGVNSGGTGTPYFVFPAESGGQGFLIQPTEKGPGVPLPGNEHPNIVGNRLTWKELR
jgi:type IV pilus assembly protein PilY1